MGRNGVNNMDRSSRQCVGRGKKHLYMETKDGIVALDLEFVHELPVHVVLEERYRLRYRKRIDLSCSSAFITMALPQPYPTQ